MQTRMFLSAIGFIVIGIFCFMGGGYGTTLGIMFVLAAIVCGGIWYLLWSTDQRRRMKTQRSYEQAPMVQKQRKPPMSDPRSRRLTGGNK